MNKVYDNERRENVSKSWYLNIRQGRKRLDVYQLRILIKLITQSNNLILHVKNVNAQPLKLQKKTLKTFYHNCLSVSYESIIKKLVTKDKIWLAMGILPFVIHRSDW